MSRGKTKEKRRRLTWFGLLLSVVFCLAACGGPGRHKAEEQAGTREETEPETGTLPESDAEAIS